MPVRSFASSLLELSFIIIDRNIFVGHQTSNG